MKNEELRIKNEELRIKNEKFGYGHYSVHGLFPPVETQNFASVSHLQYHDHLSKPQRTRSFSSL